MNPDQNFSSLTLDALFKELGSSEKGLSSSRAKKVLKQVSKGKKVESRFLLESKLLLRQFKNPLVLLLLAAVILSGILEETTDMFIILFILTSTALLSFLQELNAGRAVEKLQKLLQPVSLVLRDNQTIQINSENLVPGDILLLKAGDIIPADCRIIESSELHVNESTLTGESFPVEKMAGTVKEDVPLNEKSNSLWQGTHIISGFARGLVVYTGENTLFGKIRESLETESETVFEKGIKDFGIFLLRITLVLSIVILVVNLFFNKPFSQAVLFSLAIAVGMAPELLPAIMTLSMSAGAKRMLQKKVIVKKLTSIVNMGEVTVLCTDKTGTLTEGTSKVNRIVDTRENENELLYQYAKANAVLQQGFNNPIDQALSLLGTDISDFEKTAEIPYDFIRKRLTVLTRTNKENILITKGAVSNILEICSYYLDNNIPYPLTPEYTSTLNEQFKKHGEDGYRVLGLAYRKMEGNTLSKSDEKELIFMGFILLEDPLKEGAVDSIKRLRELNTGLKIITGDNRYIAAYTAHQLGLNTSRILTGAEFNSILPEALVIKVKQTDIFAEIEPHQKESIIKALQKSGEAVAYMGDGINDVAAIHVADTGISVNDAVDVAKEAADFVLLEKDLSVLADGIYEGRKTFRNALKYIFINTGATFGNMFSVAGASLILPFLPMLPKQILLTNFLTDFPYLAVSNDNVDPEYLKRPSHWDFKLIKRFMLVFGLHSSLFDFLTFSILFFYLKTNETGFHTGWFLESVITELLILIIIRSRKSFWKTHPSNWLIRISLTMGILAFYIPYSPINQLLGMSALPLKTFLIIVLVLIFYLVTGDLLKIWFFKNLDRQSTKRRVSLKYHL